MYWMQSTPRSRATASAGRKKSRSQLFGSGYETLTARERQVIALVTSGKMNKQMAGELQLSEITIKVYRGARHEKNECQDACRSRQDVGAAAVGGSRAILSIVRRQLLFLAQAISLQVARLAPMYSLPRFCDVQCSF